MTSPNMAWTSPGSTFATFLAEYNGKLPAWTATASGAGHGKYRKNSNGLNFTYSRGEPPGTQRAQGGPRPARRVQRQPRC